MIAPAAAATFDDILTRVSGLWAPPTTLTVSEFADTELTVTTGPLAGTRWQTDFAPYQRGILNAFHEPGIEFVVVQTSSQVGKTSIATAICAYHMAHDPCPILVVEPTVDPMAKDFAQNRLEPLIAASPRLQLTVSKKRAKDATNTTLHKTFKGGWVAIGGANSAASLAARSVRLLVLDEIDRYPAELPGEGSTIAIALKRTTAYRRRRRVLLLSSPTLQGAPIDVWFRRGDQRRFHVPCPQCGAPFVFAWSQIRWTDRDPATARIHCPACDYGLDDAERMAAVAEAALMDDAWRPTPPSVRENEHDPPRDPRVASFHLWEGMSPLSSLPEIVTGFLQARAAQKAGDRSEMHTWQNTTLGEPVAPEAGEGVEPHVLMMRREPLADVERLPAGVVCLTMGVDVQDDRLELLVVGWGPGDEAWLVDRAVLPGDTSQPEPWRGLDDVLDVAYPHPFGPRLMVQGTCIDSGGHRTTMVYDYCERRAARRVYAIKGLAGQQPIVSSPSPKRWGRIERRVPLYTVGVDSAKALVLSRLGLTEKGPGYVHLPMTDWCDEELCQQLTSERLVTKWTKGVPTQVWKKMRARNEGLDLFVYAVAALQLINPKLGLMAERLRAHAPAPAEQTKGQAKKGDLVPAPVARPGKAALPLRRSSRSSYLGR